MADSGGTNLNELIVSLRAITKKEPNTDSFKNLVKPVADKYGGFRNVTEAKLLQEIEDAKAGKIVEESEGDEPESDDDEQTQLVKVMKKKAKLQENVAQAIQGSQMLLDTVSELESRFMPKQAEHTMSPFLKENLGTGKLTFDKWKSEPKSEKEQKKISLAKKGWKQNYFADLADSLLKAADRLNKEVKKENKYWEQVLSVSEKDWSVFKLPQERGTLGVQVGATDAGPLFKPRGVVALRTNDDGSIKLHRHITAVPKAVRVRVSRDGVVSGTSRVSRIEPTLQANTPLESLLTRARDSLFDQELYHEMIIESRLLGGYNVTANDDEIHIGIDAITDKDDSYDIIVNLVPVDEYLKTQSGSPSDNKRAQLFATSLRLLLTHTYHQRLQHRSEVPPPLTERRRQPPPVVIIRPFLSFLLHTKAVEQVRLFVEHTANILCSADLPAEVKITAGSGMENLNGTLAKIKAHTGNNSDIQALMSALIRVVQTNATITLPSYFLEDDRETKDEKDWTITIKTQTVCGPPSFGVEYDITVPKMLKGALLAADKPSLNQETRFQFRDISELREYFEKMVAVDIAHNIVVPKLKQFTAVSRAAEIHRNVLLKEGGRKELKWALKFINGELTILRQWDLERDPAPQYKWDGKKRRLKFVDGLMEFMDGVTAQSKASDKTAFSLALLAHITNKLQGSESQKKAAKV